MNPTNHPRVRQEGATRSPDRIRDLHDHLRLVAEDRLRNGNRIERQLALELLAEIERRELLAQEVQL